MRTDTYGIITIGASPSDRCWQLRDFLGLWGPDAAYDCDLFGDLITEADCAYDLPQEEREHWYIELEEDLLDAISYHMPIEGN